MKIINILQKILKEQTPEPAVQDGTKTKYTKPDEPKIALDLPDDTTKPTGVSDKLVEFVKKEEYFVPCVYDDKNGSPCIRKDMTKCCLKGRTPTGIATIGYGTVYRPDGSKVKPSDKDITIEIATGYLKSTLDSISKKLITRYPNLSQQQLDGLSSLCYNVGYAGCTSKAPNLSASITKDPNSKTNPNIKTNFLDFTNIKRRTSEFSIYDDGNYQIA